MTSCGYRTPPHTSDRSAAFLERIPLNDFTSIIFYDNGVLRPHLEARLSAYHDFGQEYLLASLCKPCGARHGVASFRWDMDPIISDDTELTSQQNIKGVNMERFHRK
jgi:hypothetical protein